MKKVTVKNFILDFIFLTATLHFPQKHQSRSPFFFSSFVCIVEEVTYPLLFLLSLTVGSKSYGFSLLKSEKLSSESE